MANAQVPKELVVRVKRSEQKVTIVSREFEMSFEAKFFASKSENFAVWATLPIAMRTGAKLIVEGNVCPLVLENAQQIAKTWSIWLPGFFYSSEVESEGVAKETMGERGAALMLYSGGVDSTYALTQLRAEGATPVGLLTVHGMDYRNDDKDRFEKFLKKTDNFRDMVASAHHIMRSNVSNSMKLFGIKPGYGHGFRLFSSLFLYEDLYKKGLIAADRSQAQYHIVMPWGTNHYTNNMFRSKNFTVETLNTNVTRAEKVSALSDNPVSLSALSFCSDYYTRPENCGRCPKCMRTKAMFYAATGTTPNIFVNNSYGSANISKNFDYSRPQERIYAEDLMAMAIKTGRRDEFSELEKRLRAEAILPKVMTKLWKLKVKFRKFRWKLSSGNL